MTAAFKRTAPYRPEFLAEMHRRLLALRTKLVDECRDLGELALRPSDQDSGFENPADFGSEENAQEVNLDLLSNEAEILLEIEDALDRLNGRGDLPFGLCAGCETEPQHRCVTCPWVPQRRLRFLPWTRNCEPVQEGVEREQERDSKA